MKRREVPSRSGGRSPNRGRPTRAAVASAVARASGEPLADGSAPVVAVDRVLAVFQAFHRLRRPLPLTELAQETGIPKSSCHAIVKTLVARGQLYSLTRPRALYPTRSLYDLTREIHASDPLIERTMPILEQLREASGETVILGKQQGQSVIYLQVLESHHAIRYSARPGEFKPLHSSAAGKALLGSLKEPDLKVALTTLPLPRVTGETLIERSRLMQDVIDSRRRGYFVSRGENVTDVWAVSTTLNLDAQTLAVVVAGPRHRMQGRVLELARLLQLRCASLARQWACD